MKWVRKTELSQILPDSVVFNAGDEGGTSERRKS